MTNAFLELKEATSKAQQSRPKGAPALQSTNSINKAPQALSAVMNCQGKEKKQRFNFALYHTDRKTFDELAIKAGYVSPSGQPNASAYFTDIIHFLANN